MNCRVIFRGQTGEFFSKGELLPSLNGFLLKYTLDGDRCELCVEGKTVRQTREGSVNIQMSFKQSEQSLCYIRDGELSGCFPVFTYLLSSSVNEEGAKLNLEYECADEKITLEVIAEVL